MKYFKFYFFILLSALLCSCSSDNEKGESDPEPPIPPVETERMVKNGDMESTIVLEKVERAIEGEWKYIGGWNDSKVTVSHNENKGYKNSKCLIINAPEETDVNIVQKISGLTKGEYYIASAYIKTEDVVGGSGATLSLVEDNNPWPEKSIGLLNTNNWTRVEFEIDEITSDNITLGLRIGYTAGASKGIAYFDNVALTKNNNLFFAESAHVKLVINKKETSVSETAINTWLSNLDKIYKSYKELFKGRVPFEGEKNIVRSKEINAWAYAGYPIQWNKDYVASELESIQNEGNWSFGIMHEIGHNFASHIGNSNYSWNWNEEIFANFRMYYALEKTGGSVVLDISEVVNGKEEHKRKKFTGNELAEFYKSYSSGGYDKTFGASKAAGGDGIMYTMIRIQKKYGWQIFIDSFDELYNLPRNESEEKNWTSFKKFSFFMETLSKYAGEDVMKTYTDNEIKLIKEALE